MKNKSMLLKLILFSAWLVVSFACGLPNQTGGNADAAANTTDTTNAAKPETNSNVSGTDTATLIAESQKGLNLPPPNPIENPKAESFYSNTVFFEVPAQWKRNDTAYNDANFKSPDGKLILTASVLETEKKSYKNMAEEFAEKFPVSEKYGETKMTMMPVGGTPGILTLQLKNINNPNTATTFISWENYPPPDSAGKTKLLMIMVIFPKTEFEQHKQLISNLFGAVRFKKS